MSFRLQPFSVDVDIKDNGEEKIQTIDVEMHGEEAVRAGVRDDKCRGVPAWSNS